MSFTSEHSAGVGSPMLSTLTPVLVVENVKASLAFWIERFGFEQTNAVPGPHDTLIFASVQKGAIEIMYQSRESVLEDGTFTSTELDGRSVVLFLSVGSIDEVERALAGAPVVKARHQTFYGSTEIYVKEPGGHTVGFAQMGSGR